MDPHTARAIIYWRSKHAESEKRIAETLGKIDKSFSKTEKALDGFYGRIDKAITPILHHKPKTTTRLISKT
jgi:hypothetical protein